MICKNCGSTIADDSLFCTECGSMVDNKPAVQVPDFNFPPVQAENYDYANDAIPEEEIVYDPETNAENAKTFIAGAKSKLPLAIVAVALPFGVAMLFALVALTPLVGIPVYIFLCLAAFIAGLICLCISKSSVKKLPVVIPEMLDPELLEEYNSAERKLKPVRILHKVGSIYYLVDGIIRGLGLLVLVSIPLIVLLFGALGIALPVGLSAIMSALSAPLLLLSELQYMF